MGWVRQTGPRYVEAGAGEKFVIPIISVIFVFSFGRKLFFFFENFNREYSHILLLKMVALGAGDSAILVLVNLSRAHCLPSWILKGGDAGS